MTEETNWDFFVKKLSKKEKAISKKAWINGLYEANKFCEIVGGTILEVYGQDKSLYNQTMAFQISEEIKKYIETFKNRKI